ncbi:MAG: hypothetical protein ACXWVJ_08595 [Caulobacteraceae bacterium]
MPPIAAMIADPRLAAEPIGGAVKHGVRYAWLGLGFLVIGVGVVGAVLPGHLGVPLLAVGLAIVLRNSRTARKHFVKAQHRHPNVVFPLRRILRRWQDIVPVAWHQLLRTERFLLRRFHVLRKARRHIRRTR